jgi:Holliday junction DNA helicase RuvB
VLLLGDGSYKIDIMLDSGPAARSVQIGLNPFALRWRATTRALGYDGPLQARFSITYSARMHYDAHLLKGIVLRSAAAILGTPSTKTRLLKLPDARAARPSPTTCCAAPRLCPSEGRWHDHGRNRQVRPQRLNVDQNGLDRMDNRIPATIIDKFKGGPVGISTTSPPLVAKKLGCWGDSMSRS